MATEEEKITYGEKVKAAFLAAREARLKMSKEALDAITDDGLVAIHEDDIANG